jgi:hypothetical protein
MLIYTPFALSFVTLRGIFMHFLELTYERACAPGVVLVINDNPYGLIFALSHIYRTCP